MFDASSSSRADAGFFASGVATRLINFVNLANAQLEYWSTSRAGADGLKEIPLASVYDPLTFSVRCLKNVSGAEALQDRLMCAGAADTVCGLVRNMHDFCHRCDGFHNIKSRSFSCGDMAQNRPNKKILQLSHTLANPSDTDVA